MHKIEIPDANKTIEIPADWDDCTSDQVEYIIKNAFDVVSGSITLVDFQRKLFCYFTGLKSSVKYDYQNSMGLADQANETICLLSEKLCQWPFHVQENEFGQLQAEFQYNTVINFFKEIKTKSAVLYGPADLLEDLTFAEFQWANSHSQDYFRLMKANQIVDAEEALDYFLACLYRPGTKGRRDQFHIDDIVEYASLFSQVPPWKKYCILLWYTYSISVIQSIPLTIHGSEIDFSILFPTPTKEEKEGLETRKQGLGWRGALYDLAESGVFGPIEKTERTPLFTILVYMYKKQIETLKK
jgi:hypothetical protein